MEWNGKFSNAELIQRFLTECELRFGLDLIIITQGVDCVVLFCAMMSIAS